MGLFDKETQEQKKISKKIDDLVGKRLTAAEYTKIRLETAGLTEYDFKQVKDVLKKENNDGVLNYDDVEQRIDEIINKMSSDLKKELDPALFNENSSNESITEEIHNDMIELNKRLALPTNVRLGLNKMSSVQYLFSAELKSLIDLNKILVRQNELLRRQNELIIEKLSEKK